jgi:hypothetical protein
MVNGLKIVLLQFQTKPGIGVEINEEGMKKYAIPNVPFFAWKKIRECVDMIYIQISNSVPFIHSST